jgi:hypothetical protein
MSQFLLSISLVILTTLPVYADDALFVIGDEPVKRVESSVEEQFHPTHYFSEALELLEQEQEAFLSNLKSLIYFKEKNTDGAGGFEPYNRSKHFGSWVSAEPGQSCKNTRAKILSSRSEVPVEMAPNGCTVRRGKWYDPYSNRYYTEASQIEIDHVVPLKNAYINGAHAWSKQKRCVYGNYLGNEFHLLAVQSSENSSKSDRTPERYVPPNRAYTCEYLKHWLQIKLYWRLTLTPSEKTRIVELLKENSCNLDEMTYSASEMAEQQARVRAGVTACR